MPGEPILSFEQVTVEMTPPYEMGVRQVDLALAAGELVVVFVGEGFNMPPLADAAEGLCLPDTGTVAFMGKDWRRMGAHEAAEAGGRSGRVFVGRGWVSKLDMEENVTLPQRHHTRRPEAEILAEADALARQFGLPEVPRARPALLKRADLRRAEWVRAFLGEPALIVLEHPMRDVYVECLGSLVAAQRAARDRGAAVLWISKPTGREVYRQSGPDRVYELKNETLAAVE